MKRGNGLLAALARFPFDPRGQNRLSRVTIFRVTW
jgi:hypothetical protein